MYEENQRQRELERRIHESRHECTALDAACDASKDPAERSNSEAEVAMASKLLKHQETMLDPFCEDTDRGKLVDRVRAERYNRTVSGKVTAADRKNTKSESYRSENKPS